MSHYDDCREGYCPGCGQAPGAIAPGQIYCESCLRNGNPKAARDSTPTPAQKQTEQFSLSRFGEFKTFLMKKAQEKAHNAALGGSWGDGGASQIRDQILFFDHGRSGTLPTEWRQYWKEFSNPKDPEYDEYLRLKKKFEERK